MKFILSSAFIIAAMLFSCETKKTAPLEITHINPASGYSQVVTTNHGGLTTIYVSGQIGEGDDLASQMTATLENLKNELAQAGATFDDIVKMNTYIVDYKPEDLAVFRNTRREIMGDSKMPASTLVGVTALALPEWLIEIDAVAVIETK